MKGNKTTTILCDIQFNYIHSCKIITFRFEENYKNSINHLTFKSSTSSPSDLTSIKPYSLIIYEHDQTYIFRLWFYYLITFFLKKRLSNIKLCEQIFVLWPFKAFNHSPYITYKHICFWTCLSNWT